MPGTITRRLYDELNRIVTSAEVSEKFSDLGFVVDTQNPEEFAAYIKKDSAARERAVRISGAKAE